MSTTATSTTQQTELRALLEDWAEGVRTKNVERCAVHLAPDIVLFDLAPPLRYLGAAAYRSILEEWFPSWDGPIGYEIHDLQIHTDGDVAFSSSLNRLYGKRTDGEKTDVWVRATVGFRKLKGEWRVTHEHTSVPFYMDGSYRAAVDLQP